MASPNPRKSTESLKSPVPFSSPRHGSISDDPFPRYDRQSSSGRYESRRGSIASSIHSIGGALDGPSGSRSPIVRETGQNAISTLLQPPIVRTGLLPHTSGPAPHRQPTSRDIPPVTLTNITHVENSEFKPYLTQVGALYEALQRAKEHEEDGGTQLPRKTSRQDDFADFIQEELGQARKQSLSRKASLVSLASLTTVQEAPRARRRASGARRALQVTTPLSTIPPVYFEPDFHLENPRTFDVVSERSEVVRPAPGSPDEKRASNGSFAVPRKALATNAILQEKLSWYMDTIEVHLIASISTASTSFFAALGSLRELHAEAAESVQRIKGLRAELEILDKTMAIGGLNIVNMKQKRENLKQLGDAVAQLRYIADGAQHCETLVDNGQVEEALNAIDALERLIVGEESAGFSAEGKIQLRDLRNAKALQGFNGDMSALRFRIGKTFESRFLDALIGDLRYHVDSVSPADTLQRWSAASQRTRGMLIREPLMLSPAYMKLNDGLRSELLSDLKGLRRARYTSPATAAYRDAVLKEVKGIIKRPLPSSNDDDNESMVSVSTVGGRQQKTQQERSAALARNLRALDPESAEELLVQVYIGVGETLRRLGTQVKLLLDVTSTLGDGPDGIRSPPRSPRIGGLDSRVTPGIVGPSQSAQEMQEEMHEALDMSNLLGQAVEIAQVQIVKVLKVRSEQSVAQPLPYFLRYFTMNLLFANECEAVSGRSGVALKTVVNGHIKEFVQGLTRNEREKLATGMESDDWSARDFDERHTKLLSRVLEGSTHDVEAWKSGSKVWIPHEETPAVSEPAANGSAQANGAAKPAVRKATIESEAFILPNSALLCLTGLEKYLHLTSAIPSMTSDIATSLVDYLSVFDSRCKQLILGAGATRTAGLKNITTKHLALASQALSFIGTLIPHIRETVRRHAGSGAGALMGEFDRVRRLYQEHQTNIYDKLVDIMAGRAATLVKTMKAIDWDKLSPGTAVNPYMASLCKDTTTLYRVLDRHLPNSSLSMITGPVFKSYRDQWGKAFGNTEVKTKEGKVRLVRDADYFCTQMSKLDGSDDLGPFILKVAEAKEVSSHPEAAAATEVATSKGIGSSTIVEEKSETVSPPPQPVSPAPASESTTPTEASTTTTETSSGRGVSSGSSMF